MSELKKELTLYGLIMIAVGSCIGAGIFRTPSLIATELPNPTLILLVWIIGGIVALTGALTFAELGAKFPKAGGVYVFIKEAYGDLVAFLYGWVILLVITSGAIAALALTFADYFDKIYPIGSSGVLILAISAIIFLTFINVFGVKIGELFSNVFTTTKLIGIACIILVGILIAAPNAEPIDFSNTALSLPPTTTLAGAFSVALISVLWSYGGWHHASYLAGEAKNAKRTVPRAMVIGALIVTLTYVLTNLAYLYLLPMDVLKTSKAVAADAIGTIYPNGGKLVAILIAVSTFGTIGIYTMSAPRIYFAMAKDGNFFKGLAKVHPVYKTPINAILLQSVWAILLLIFWKKFEHLITYVTFMDWVFMTLAAICIFIFRKRSKENSTSTYQTWGYPIIPLIFIGISLWFILNTLIERPTQTLAGLGLLVLGLPFYYIFKKAQ